MAKVIGPLFPRLKRRGPIEADRSAKEEGVQCTVSTSEKTWPH